MKTFIRISKEVRKFSPFIAKRMLNYLVRKEVSRYIFFNRTGAVLL